MAFGFFKKREYADLIFFNGSIYTMNPDEPTAEAVACREGTILATGSYEDLRPLVNDDTQVVDLQGNAMFPGFIQLTGAPAQKAFYETCSRFPQWQGFGLPPLLSALDQAIREKSDDEALFFYGGFRSQLSGLTIQEIREAMDTLCPDRPVMVLPLDCSVCLLNTCAADAVKAAAEEDGVMSISLDYIVSVIAPQDYEQYQSAVAAQCRDASARGFTTVYDCDSFDYPQAVYRGALQELLLEGQMPHRYLSAYLMTFPEDRALLLRRLRQRQTECMELEGMICCDGLHIAIRPVPSANVSEEESLNFEEDVLQSLCVDAADIGCDLMLTAHSQEGLNMAAAAVGAVRDSGYKKNAAILRYDDVLSDKEMYEYVPKEEVFLWGDLDPLKADSVQQLLERLTIDSADALGMMDQLGSIRKGMAADFTVLCKDPFKGAVDDFFNIPCAFTVVNGRIISKD